MRRATTRKADPIFALVERSRAAEARHSQALKVEDGLDNNDPGHAAADKAVDTADATCRRAMRALCNTAPTTAEGLHALLSHLEVSFNETMGGQYFDGRTSDLWKTLIRFAKTQAEASTGPRGQLSAKNRRAA